MLKEVELQKGFGISRLSDYQEYQFNNVLPAEKMLMGLPLYDMLYNQLIRNQFEWNQQFKVNQSDANIDETSSEDT